MTVSAIFCVSASLTTWCIDDWCWRDISIACIHSDLKTELFWHNSHALCIDSIAAGVTEFNGPSTVAVWAKSNQYETLHWLWLPRKIAGAERALICLGDVVGWVDRALLDTEWHSSSVVRLLSCITDVKALRDALSIFNEVTSLHMV